MRLVSRIPAGRGKVKHLKVRVQYDGTEDSDAVDVTDVQLQPGSPSGVVPNPCDVLTLTGVSRWRNGVVNRTTDEVIVMANEDFPAPTTIEATPARPSAVRVGSFRFGRVLTRATANGKTSVASQGWGRPPVLTERCDGHVPVVIDQPTHVSIGWEGKP